MNGATVPRSSCTGTSTRQLEIQPVGAAPQGFGVAGNEYWARTLSNPFESTSLAFDHVFVGRHQLKHT